MSGDLDHPHQLNNEIFTQEILIEAEDGVRYLVNLGGEECYENQVSNYEVNDCEKVHLFTTFLLKEIKLKNLFYLFFCYYNNLFY